MNKFFYIVVQIVLCMCIFSTIVYVKQKKTSFYRGKVLKKREKVI